MTKKLPRTAVWLMGFLIFLSVFRDLLANGRPLYCRIAGESYFPGLRTVFVSEDEPYDAPALRKLQNIPNQLEVWKDPSNFDTAPIYAPIPFSPGEYSTQKVCAYVRPGGGHEGLDKRFVHWLGTDSDGRDVAATVVSGARIAMLTGTLAMAIALILGLNLGMIAGFFGDDRLKLNALKMLFYALALPVALFYGLIARSYVIATATSSLEWAKSIAIVVFIMWMSGKLTWFFRNHTFSSKTIVFPADLLIMRLAEVFSSIPRLIVVIVLAVALQGITKDSIWLMIALIGAFGWTSVARLVRAELLKVRTTDYIAAARGLGFTEARVLLRHALPNTLRPIYIVFALGAANAVLLEASLSFLGYGGISFIGVSWGSLFINENSNTNPLETWWVSLFPGLMIFITVLSLNLIGEALSDRERTT